ncbi:MAG TPA: hypothetical protein VNK43_13650 [Gemmatimonadales bacterium]|nr:hypothetical protein [Gemmatimonadales bacterium]
MTDRPPRPGPLRDALGDLCFRGRDLSEYLWQVPDDPGVRGELRQILARIRDEAAKGGRREMGRIVEELETALAATPSPQQVDILQDGFDRLTKLWQAAKSGLL